MEIGAVAICRAPGILEGMIFCVGEPTSPDPEVVAFARIADERLREDPGDADALFVLAASRIASGQVSEAASLLVRLTQVHADYPGVWQLRRTVHEALGEHRAAEACKREALRRGDA